MLENLPNTNMPTAFDDFEESQRFERWMTKHGSTDGQGELWYDVRPRTGYGTVETRTPDAQIDPGRATDFVEYVHASMSDLVDHYETGESRMSVRRELFDENKRRTTRYGRDMDFIAPDSEGVVSLVSFVEIGPNRSGVDGFRSLLDTELRVAAQRWIHEESGLDNLCEHPTLD